MSPIRGPLSIVRVPRTILHFTYTLPMIILKRAYICRATTKFKFALEGRKQKSEQENKDAGRSIDVGGGRGGGCKGGYRVALNEWGTG